MSVGAYVAIFVPIVVIILALVIWAAILGQRHKIVTGEEGLIGITGVAQSDLDPQGAVFIEGERWEAVAENGRIESGEEVIVSKVEGLRIWVIKKSK